MNLRILDGILSYLCLSLFLIFTSQMSYCEGTKQLMPGPVPYTAGLYIVNSSVGEYPDFAVAGCQENYRLNIHIRNAGEEILFGLRSPSYPPAIQYNLRKPDGTVALSGICPVSTSQTGFIATYAQAVTGPFPSVGGYNPLRYKVVNPSDTGSFYFEIVNPIVNYSYIFEYFDFQVVSGEHPEPVPSDMINGRVWSRSWQVYTALYPDYVFNGAFYIYSDDGIVTKLAFSDARIGAATLFCNPYGCVNTGNFISDRQSRNQNTFLTFPGIADYRVFLNDPDSTIYPSGVFGQITGPPEMIPDTSFPPCSGPQLILVSVNKAGNVDITLTFPYGSPGTTVNLFANVVPGINHVPWDGLDGQNDPVPDGTPVTMTVTFADGLTNLPIWDQETNPMGFIISLVRPFNPSGQIVETFWDDTLLTPFYMCPVAPQTSNLSGCMPGSIPGYPGCHPWGLNEEDCHDKMINTWWYGSSNTIATIDTFPGKPVPPVAFGDTRCGPGALVLHATPPPFCTVDWYDTIAGGFPLLTGDTTFITPVIQVTTTFYAESRNVTTGCISPTRTPAVGTILPVPMPSIHGPDTVCAGTPGHLYITEPGKIHYHWWLSSGGVITSPDSTSTISVTWIEPGHHSVFVTYSDTNGCKAALPAQVIVGVLSLPGITGPVSGPGTLCARSQGIVYQVAPVFWATGYNWSLPYGFIIAAGAGTNRITVNLDPDAVSGDISVFATNECGEGLPSPLYPVSVIPPPEASAGPGDTVCQPTPYTVTGASASGYTSLFWTTSGTGTMTDQTTLTPTYIPDQGETGMVTLTLIAESQPCQPDSSSLSLLIEPSPEANAGEDLTSCFPEPVSIDGDTASNYLSLHWSTSGSGTFDHPSALHPVYLPGEEDLTAGLITLTLTVTGFGHCGTRSDDLQLTLLHPPEGDAGPDAVICKGISYQVTGATAGFFSALHWNHDGEGSMTGDSTISPVYLPAEWESGIVTLTLEVTGEQTCSDSLVTDKMEINIYDLVTEAGPDLTVDSGASAALNGMVYDGSGQYTVSWFPAELVIIPSELETYTLPVSVDIWFKLVVTDLVSGCTSTDSLQVHVHPPSPPEPECLEIYNVITPNGDGINDTWIIRCIEQYPANNVLILNRWGDLIRRFERYDNSMRVWDGTNAQGEPVPDGTYYYILTIKERNPYTGWIFVRGGSK